MKKEKSAPMGKSGAKSAPGQAAGGASPAKAAGGKAPRAAANSRAASAASPAPRRTGAGETLTAPCHSARKAAGFSLLVFAAMTIQTGRMSLLLCGLAVLSLIGRAPLVRLRRRFCVPALALLAYGLMQGLAAIYSPFDATAVSEYYRFFASFSLAVIFLTRFDREDVPALLWGLSGVSAAIGLLSVDAAVSGFLFSGFNAFTELLGATFASIQEADSANRINGLYNDANVTAAMFAVGTLFSLRCAFPLNGGAAKAKKPAGETPAPAEQSAGDSAAAPDRASAASASADANPPASCASSPAAASPAGQGSAPAESDPALTAYPFVRTLAGCLLLGVNAMAFFLSMSRGAILFFALACLLWLALCGRGNRVALLLHMAAAAAVTVGCSIPAMSGLRGQSLLPTLLTVLAGGLLFVAERWGVRYLIRLSARYARASAAVVAGVFAVAAVYCAAALTVTGPAAVGGIYQSLSRSCTVDAGTYTLTGDYDDTITRIRVSWRDRTGALMNQWTTLYYDVPGDISFTAPDAGTVEVTLFGVAGSQVRALELSDGTRFTLGRPLLPAFITERLQDSLKESYSSLVRAQYMKDAWTLIRQAPLTGHGLGATENLYRSVQPFAYESKYVHCQPLQVLCETGLLGFLAFYGWMLGAAWLCLRALCDPETREDGLPPVLLAAWVFFSGHSCMEILFSIRAFQCYAYLAALLPIVLYAAPLLPETVETAKQRRRSFLVGGAFAGAFALYLAVFGILLEVHRGYERDDAPTVSGVAEYLQVMKTRAESDVFTPDRWQISYVANAVGQDSPVYSGAMQRYVSALRKTGTYENCTALERYYYLPRQDWETLFAVSREGVAQVRSSPDGWNLQMEFYRTAVLPEVADADAETYLAGVLALGDALDALNASGRLETVELTEDNAAFLSLARQVSAQNLPGGAALEMLAALAPVETTDAAE